MTELTQRFKSELSQKDQMIGELRDLIKQQARKIEELSKLIATRNQNNRRNTRKMNGGGEPWRVGSHTRSVEEPSLYSAISFYHSDELASNGSSSASKKNQLIRKNQ